MGPITATNPHKRLLTLPDVLAGFLPGLWGISLIDVDEGLDARVLNLLCRPAIGSSYGSYQLSRIQALVGGEMTHPLLDLFEGFSGRAPLDHTLLELFEFCREESSDFHTIHQSSHDPR